MPAKIFFKNILVSVILYDCISLLTRVSFIIIMLILFCCTSTFLLKFLLCNIVSLTNTLKCSHFKMIFFIYPFVCKILSIIYLFISKSPNYSCQLNEYFAFHPFLHYATVCRSLGYRPTDPQPRPGSAC